MGGEEKSGSWASRVISGRGVLEAVCVFGGFGGRDGEGGIPASRVLEAFKVEREEGEGRLEMEGEAVVGYLRVERAALEAVLPIVVVWGGG